MLEHSIKSKKIDEVWKQDKTKPKAKDHTMMSEKNGMRTGKIKD